MSKTQLNTFDQIEDEFPELRQNLVNIVRNSITKTDQLLKLLPAAERAPNSGFSHLIRVLIHIFLWASDLAGLLLAGMNSKESQNVLTRVVSVHLYDMAINLMPRLLGKEFRSDVRSLPEFEANLSHFNQIHGRLSNFKNSHRRMLQRTRNNAMAHRDEDVRKICREFNELPEEKILLAAKDYLGLLRELMAFLGNQVSADNNLAALGKRSNGVRVKGQSKAGKNVSAETQSNGVRVKEK